MIKSIRIWYMRTVHIFAKKYRYDTFFITILFWYVSEKEINNYINRDFFWIPVIDCFELKVLVI